MGADFPRRSTQTGDAIRAMRQLWITSESMYQRRYYQFPAVRSFPKPVRKPHPPVLLGGMGAKVFQRIIKWRDGCIPAQISVDQITRGRATLGTLAEQVGRDPGAPEIFAFGMPGEFRGREKLFALDEAGTAHVTIWLTETEREEAIAELEELAAKILI